MIDLRSDTSSIAPPQMLQLMHKAKVGDDVFDDDETANLLQNRFATLFHKQSALFFPSASMGNLISVMAWTRPGQQVIIGADSHAVNRQCSSFSHIAGVQTRQIWDKNGKFKAEDIKPKIRKYEQLVAYPNTTLLFLENATFMGQVYNLKQLEQISKVCAEKKTKFHIDGARIFNALQQQQLKAQQISHCYDSMTICLSKGLGCPIGALVIGSKKFIDEAKFLRKSIGGGMRQIGLLCAAGLYALDHMIQRISEDHLMAHLIAKQLQLIQQIKVQKVSINMIFFNFLIENFPHEQYRLFLKEQGKIKIKAFNLDWKCYRVMTHNGIGKSQCHKFVQITKEFLMKKQ